MRYWNEFDVQDAIGRFGPSCHNLTVGVLILTRLMNWTNGHSDGWAYWPKPCRSANRLMELMDNADRFDPQDVTVGELRKACTPIKAFLTRQSVDHELIFADTSV